MKDYIGKKVLVRSYDAGVYFGTLETMKGDVVKISQARNIWRWKGASCLSQVANEGIKDGSVGPVVSSMVITRVCQVMPLTDAAIINLESHKQWIC